MKSTAAFDDEPDKELPQHMVGSISTRHHNMKAPRSGHGPSLEGISPTKTQNSAMIKDARYSTKTPPGRRALLRPPGIISALLLLITLCAIGGCVEVRDHLVINADGSGSIEIITSSHIPAGPDMIAMFRNPGTPLPAELYYPPFNMYDAQKLFPKELFEVEMVESPENEHDPATHLKVSFRTINQLLESPYAKAHGLQITRTDNRLVVKIFSGLQALAAPSFWEEYPGAPRQHDLFDLGPLKKMADKLQAQFTLTMPAPMHTGDGSPARASHTWKLAGPIIRTKDPTLPGLDTGMVADCSAEHISFNPDGPLRPEQYDYTDLPEKSSSGKENDEPNSAAIAAALRYIPISLTINDSFDYWGENNYLDNRARLLGAFTLPDSLAPSNWGVATITEITDNTGTDLLFSDQPQFIRTIDQFNNNHQLTAATANTVYHFTEIEFKSPPINATHLSTTRGSIELHYDGRQSLHKLDEVISEEAISRNVENMFMFFQGEPHGLIRTISFPEQGPEITFNSCFQKEGTTFISLKAGEKGRISSLYLYDNTGHHWPGFFMELPQLEGQFVLFVPGTPSPPFSFGMISNQGPIITTEFSVQHLKLNSNPEPDEKS